MSEWKLKRFWKEASADAEAGESGFRILLDGRAVRTPAKALLAVPTPEMASAIAAEWNAQEKEIDPRVMPMTRAANAAIDKVAAQHAEVVAMLAAYAETDLLCHRADAPQRLVDQQNKGWNPILSWAEATYSAPLVVVSGILPAVQPPASLAAYADAVAAFQPFSLTALHDLITLSGSLVLGLSVANGQVAPITAWKLSRIDEDWQIAQWGEDEEATEAVEIKRAAFLHAASFLGLAQGR